MISGNSLVFSREIITKVLVLLPVLRPRRVSTSSGKKSVSHSHRPEKGGFCQKNPPFPRGPSMRQGDSSKENSLFQDEGNWGFLGPETLFARKWGFGPCLGSGESQSKPASWKVPFLFELKGESTFLEAPIRF